MTEPTGTKPYLDQQIHVLVDEDMRAFTLGLADLRAEETGRRPAEGDAVRELLVSARERLEIENGTKVLRAIVERGRAELMRRASGARG